MVQIMIYICIIRRKEEEKMFKIGFGSDTGANSTFKKSLVQVSFPGHGSLAYYNDRFDLKTGDFVYVDGKLEGIRGRVEEVNYNFKIRLSDYKKVISVVDTDVKGRLFSAGSNFVAFDRGVIPSQKVRGWFMPPLKEEDEYVSGSDGSSFPLADPEAMDIPTSIADRGRNYYTCGRVVYLELDGEKGYAIVRGSKAYEVEFTCQGGEISELNCSCFCSYRCKHEYAAMLQLKELLEKTQKDHTAEYERSGYFAAIRGDVLFGFALDERDSGSITLE